MSCAVPRSKFARDVSPLRLRVKRTIALCAGAFLALSCSEPDETDELMSALASSAVASAEHAPERAPHIEINPRLLRRFQPLRSQLETHDNPLTNAKVELGRLLFFETRLSKNQDISCNSCHKLDQYGVDNKPTSNGHRAQPGTRNSPTVYNAAGFFAQFWDGRADTVEKQALGPILNPMEMALPNAEYALRVLRSMPEYRERFRTAFPKDAEPLTFDNIGRALGAFERRLTTPARWDDYLRGNQSALTDHELQGLKVFTNIGCMVCHTGEFVGGGMYQKVGIVEPWPNQRDQGRFELTKQEVDRMVFKVPTLRNVTKTAPYFHDGSVATLDDAVRRMGKHQLGLSLSDVEVSALIAWLDSLTGEVPAAYITPPLLPGSTAETPAPDPT